MISREGARDSADFEGEIAKVGRLAQLSNGDPAGSGDFFVRIWLGLSGHGEHKGAGKYRDLRSTPRSHIVQRSEEVVGRQDKTDLFPGLSNGRGEQVLICRITAASRQSHVPRPGIPCSFGPPDDEYGIGIGTDYQGHRSLADSWLVYCDCRSTMKP